ncbi:MAG: hypothetical protein ACI8V2_002243 [Candidatus Latescibacterota bacterium]|jgi:hypothetical protein
MNRNQYEKWSMIREKGKRHFVWFQGVLMWGIITGIMWSVAMAYYSPSEHIYIRPIIALIIFPISGYFGSKWTWNKNEQKYNVYESENE